MAHTQHRWPDHLATALAAPGRAMALLDAAGFPHAPFSFEISDKVLRLCQGAGILYIRKPELSSAHQSLSWQVARADIERLLGAEITPLLHALRADLPVLTGPAGSVSFQYTPERAASATWPFRPAQLVLYVNSVRMEAHDLTSALHRFAPAVAHLRPVSLATYRASQADLVPMAAATLEEDEAFRKAVRDAVCAPLAHIPLHIG